MIENLILNNLLKDDEQAPSSTAISLEYNINHITVLKAINILVDENILYKKRGLGMFVSKNAKELILKKRKEVFIRNYIKPLLKESKNLDISIEEIIKLIKENN